MKSIPYIASVLSGIAVWIGIGVIIGNHEAWDNRLYWQVGIPFLALVTFIIGFLEPKTPYIWGVIQALSQSIVILLGGILFGHSLNLWPLSIAVNIVLAIPSIISAFLGVALCNYIKRQRTER